MYILCMQVFLCPFLHSKNFIPAVFSVCHTSLSITLQLNLPCFITLGPFARCHSYVDPSSFYDTCIFDLCETLPEDGDLCNSLQEYAVLCRSRGGEPDDWRSQTPQCRESDPSVIAFALKILLVGLKVV